MGKEKALSRKIIALIVAVVMVAVAFSSFAYIEFGKKTQTGPNIEIHANFIDSKNNSKGIFRTTIFSIVPKSIGTGGHNLTAMNQSNNPYEVLLFNGKSNGAIISGILSQTFWNIVNEWKSVISNNTYTVSLMMYSYYQYEHNGNLYVFEYYNNIPYSPFSVPYLFNISTYFNLTHPVAVFPLPNTNNSVVSKVLPNAIIGLGPCNANTTILYQNTTAGPLPILAAGLTLPSNSGMVYSFSRLSGTVELSFTSASASSTQQSQYSSTVASTSPSWSGTDYSFDYTGAGSSVNPDSIQHNTSMIYISGVTYNVVEKKTEFFVPYGNSCAYDGTVYSTSISIINVKNDNYSPLVNFLYNLANNGTHTYWWSALNAMGLKESTSVYLTPGSSSSLVNYCQLASGFTNAADAEQTALKYVSTITAAIGAGFAIQDLLSIIPIADSAADVINTLSDSLALAGLSTAIISAFTTISYSTSTSLSFNAVTVTNNPYTGSGSNLNVYFYESNFQSSLNINGTIYSFNLPAFYIKAIPT